MSKYKLVIDFTPYPAAELVTIAKNIQQHLNSQASSFPDIPFGSGALIPLIAVLQAALVARENGGKSEVIAAELARHNMEDALRTDGEYLNGKLDGTETAALSVGYPYYSSTPGPLPNPPLAPTNLVLKHGPLSGVVRLRYKPDRRDSFNEVQACEGDPNIEANWQHVGFFRGGTADVAGQPPGVLRWYRVRTGGLKGVMGAWSDPAQIRVI